jgi:hypothetical protein
VSTHEPFSEERAAWMLHRLLLDLLAHELREGITVAGRRVLDPHAEPPAA